MCALFQKKQEVCSWVWNYSFLQRGTLVISLFQRDFAIDLRKKIVILCDAILKNYPSYVKWFNVSTKWEDVLGEIFLDDCKGFDSKNVYLPFWNSNRINCMQIESQINKFLSRAYIVHTNAKEVIRRRWIGWKRSCQTCTTTFFFHSSMCKLVTLSPSMLSFLVFLWRHGGHVGAPKQRNGSNVGVSDSFSGCRVYSYAPFLFRLQNMAADHVSENQQ